VGSNGERTPYSERSVLPGSGASLDLRSPGWSPAVPPSPRYASRIHWEAERCEREQARELKQSQRLHSASRSTHDVRGAMDVTELVTREFPHGAPRSVLRHLRAQGLEVPNLGYGSEACLPARSVFTLR